MRLNQESNREITAKVRAIKLMEEQNNQNDIWMDSIVTSTKPSADSLPGFYEPAASIQLGPLTHSTRIPGIDEDQAVIIRNALTHNECAQLIEFMNQSDNFEDVGVQGMMDQKDERIGSKRTSIWAPEVAHQIWQRVMPFLKPKMCTKFTPTDWWQDNDVDYNMFYKPIGMSPLLRFMQYENGGQHYAHYDASYIYPISQYRTLKSVVIYLTTNYGAATRFVKDGQNSIPINERNHMDWDRPVKDEEIIGKSECIRGNILIFDHRLCHDVEQYLGTEKRIIIRGDIIYVA